MEKMSADELEKFNNIIRNIERDGMSNLGMYLHQTYEKEDVYAINGKNN